MCVRILIWSLRPTLFALLRDGLYARRGRKREYQKGTLLVAVRCSKGSLFLFVLACSRLRRMMEIYANILDFAVIDVSE